MNKLYNYTYGKLVASGFVFFICISVIFIMTGFDMYELSETLNVPSLWIAFYPYAIITSLMMDVLSKTRILTPNKSSYKHLIGYQLFGFIQFIFIFIFPSIALIAIVGTVNI